MPIHNHEVTSTPSVFKNLAVASLGNVKYSNASGNSQDPASSFPAKTKSGIGGGDTIYETDSAKIS